MGLGNVVHLDNGSGATAAAMYGASLQAPTVMAAAHPVAAMGPDDKTGWRALVDPQNPLLWIGVVILVTLGAGSVAGSVRLGRAKATASLGKSEG